MFFSLFLSRQIDSAEKKLLKADLHGARVSVVQSKTPSLVGVTGLLIQETQEAFKILTMRNRVKIVPKRSSIFTIYLDHAKKHIYDVPSSSATGNNGATPIVTPDPSAPNVVPTVLIYGDQFCYRSSDRLSRKFKLNSSIDMK